MTLGAVICAYTFDRYEELKAAVASLRAQTHQLERIVVVIDHNDELLAGATAEFGEHATVIANTGKQGLSGARNSGVAAIDTDVIAFLDDDASAAPEWAERVIGHYADATVIGAGGFVESDWETERPEWFPREFEWVVGCSYTGMPDSVAEVRNLIGANMSLRADVFERVGDFSTEVGRVGTKPLGCEETELCIRALKDRPDARIVYDPAARVKHKVTPARTKFSYFRERCYLEGVSKAHVVKLAGAGAGLSSERSYTAKVLPLGVLRGLAAPIAKRDLAGPARAAAIVIGLALTTAGFIRGRLFPLQAAA
ncbi:MAG: glycosyltransferase family 2 protein [Solirubrobacterales bacterium]